MGGLATEDPLTLAGLAPGCGFKINGQGNAPKMSEGDQGRKVVVIGALPESLLNFRRDLLAALAAEGAIITVMSAPASPNVVAELRNLGCRHVSFPVSRYSLAPWRDVGTFWSLYRTLRQIRPDEVLAYTIKPVIYGGIAARLLPTVRFHALITGLGAAFDESTLRGRALAAFVGALYRGSLGKARTVFVQNRDDKRYFVSRGLAPARNIRTVAGTGVNLDRFAFSPLPDGPPTFLMVARLRRSKGVIEFCEAAALVRSRYPECVFQIAGSADESKDAVSAEELDIIRKAGHVNLLGYRTDIGHLLARCHVFVLPTYYPEGRPRSIQEALAVGRPVVTTRMPGCHDAVLVGRNGWLVPPRDSQALGQRLIKLVEDRARLSEYALNARRFAVHRYDVHKINRRMIAAMFR